VAGDRAILARLRQQLQQAKQPQFIFCFLDSTHFPYLYPAEFAKYGPVIPPDVVPTIKNREETTNRYRNAALFLDHEVAETISALDPLRHLIVVTGDHGESLFDDGLFSHSGALSEIQCRTPLAIVGPGVPQKRIPQATTHADVFPTLLHALAGRQVHLANTHGRDLLAGPIDDQVLIAAPKDHPYSKETSWNAMLVHGDRRLSLWISLREALVLSLGDLDCDGKYDFRHSVDPEEADGWATLVNAQFLRLAGMARRAPEAIAGRASSGAALRR
jgi:membrane-anchored protein YejM (alkaline phosphatase superfamily)